MHKVGILYPRSGIYPLLGSDLVDGIRAATGEGPFEFMLAHIGFGENEQEAYHQAEKLLVHEKVDLVIGFVDHKLARLLDPLFLATGKLFIVVNTGANHPQNWVPARTSLFITLLNSFLCYQTGRLAVETGLKKGALAASYYDGGYLHCASMVEGYREAGGEILHNYISAPRLDDFNVSSLVNNIEELKIEACLSVFSGNEARMFLDAFAGTDAALFLSPMFFADEFQGMRSGSQGYVPWHSGIGTDVNDQFKSVILERTSRPANIFSLLGWEAGLVLNQLAEAGKSKGEELVSHLKKIELASPRGPAFFDEETHFLLPAIYKALAGSSGVEIGDPENSIESWRKFTSEVKDVRASGWTNTYPCY